MPRRAIPACACASKGHADERGSREYNIGLGERRAQAVRRALLLQGVAEAQITTVSYGEERPAVQGSDENAWAMNRRVEIVYCATERSRWHAMRPRAIAADPGARAARRLLPMPPEQRSGHAQAVDEIDSRLDRVERIVDNQGLLEPVAAAAMRCRQKMRALRGAVEELQNPE